jgi:hypothetical protein
VDGAEEMAHGLCVNGLMRLFAKWLRGCGKEGEEEDKAADARMAAWC